MYKNKQESGISCLVQQDEKVKILLSPTLPLHYFLSPFFKPFVTHPPKINELDTVVIPTPVLRPWQPPKIWNVHQDIIFSTVRKIFIWQFLVEQRDHNSANKIFPGEEEEWCVGCGWDIFGDYEQQQRLIYHAQEESRDIGLDRVCICFFNYTYLLRNMTPASQKLSLVCVIQLILTVWVI